MATDATTNPWQTIVLFILQMLGAAILALLGNRWLQRIQTREERRSRQFEEDMLWLEKYLSAMSLCVDEVEAMRGGHPAAYRLQYEAGMMLLEIFPERDMRLARITALNDPELNRLLAEFNKQSREFGIEDLEISLEQKAASASDELLARMRHTLLLAKLRAGKLRSKGPSL